MSENGYLYHHHCTPRNIDDICIAGACLINNQAGLEAVFNRVIFYFSKMIRQRFVFCAMDFQCLVIKCDIQIFMWCYLGKFNGH